MAAGRTSSGTCTVGSTSRTVAATVITAAAGTAATSTHRKDLAPRFQAFFPLLWLGQGSGPLVFPCKA